MNNTISDTTKYNPPLLQIKDLCVSFDMYVPHSFKKTRTRVVNSLSLDIMPGEIVAVVGSSGSGKSILANAILGILPKNAFTSGEILYKGRSLDKKLLKNNLGLSISYIPQSVDNLDPLMKTYSQIKGVYGNDARVKDLFDKYDLPLDTGNKYPFELSGGMARRVLIAGALIGSPDLIVADEPTPGLNIELAMETLNHFRNIADMGTGILLITHDIDLALSVADKVAFFYSGCIVETAIRSDFGPETNTLRHPFSKALFDALPQNEFKSIPGSMTYMEDSRNYCVFYDRCPNRNDNCKAPQAERLLRGGKVRCINAV